MTATRPTFSAPGARADVQAVWTQALAGAAPRASWLVREGGELLAAESPERSYPSASMIKTFLLAAVLAEVEAGRLVPEQPVTVAAERRAEGDGVLRDLALPLELPLLDVVRLMVAVSDNTATNVALDVLGGPSALNDRLAAWGFSTRMRSYVGGVGPPDARQRALGEDLGLLSPVALGVSSAAEHDGLLAALAAGELLPGQGARALALLAGQRDRGSLARRLREDAWFAHKTGSAYRARHDAGILRAGERTLHVACFTDGGPEAEWVDHPACVAMGAAMAATVELLGLDVELLPEPRPPGVGSTGARA